MCVWDVPFEIRHRLGLIVPDFLDFFLCYTMTIVMNNVVLDFCQASKSVTNDSLRRNLEQDRQTIFKRYQWEIKNMDSQTGESLQSHPCIKYAHLPFEVRSRFRITHSRRSRSNPGGTSEGSSTISPFTETLQRYDNHLAEDQSQLSILQILIEDVSKGQLVVGRTEVISNALIHGTGSPHVSA
jgi:hypothetical protein